MDWITEQIAIGNYRDAREPPDGITAILCLKSDCACENRDDVDAIQIPLIDGVGNDPKNLYEAVDFIRETVESGGKILVHCHAGRSRSVIVVARYLMNKHGMSAQEALSIIASKREICVTEGLDVFLKA